MLGESSLNASVPGILASAVSNLSNNPSEAPPASHEIRRTVRFAVGAALPDGINGFGGRPAIATLSHFSQLEVGCRGAPDPTTGYLIDIKAIDAAVRGSAIAIISESSPDALPAATLIRVFDALRADLGTILFACRWHLSPFCSLEVTMPQPDESARRVCIRQSFDLAAAHRLHVDSLSDDENRKIFGRCNNPNGHGHNYRVEPRVSMPVTDGPPPLTLDQLERLVDEVVIRPFDHKHLNLDTKEFGPGGLNPSVENIARVFFEKLQPAINAACPQASLDAISVWENDRTCCTYPAS